MAKSEDRIALLEHLEIRIAKVESQYGIITEEDLKQSNDVIKKVKFFLKCVEKIRLLKNGPRIQTLDTDGRMLLIFALNT